MALLGIIAVGEIATLAWHLFLGAPKTIATLSPPATPPKALPAPGVQPTPVQTTEQQIVAAAVEKALVNALPKPTPAPVATPTPVRVTPASRVAELIDLARGLRERGDTGTAMTRLREAQAILSNYAPIISEMAITYERMGITDKAIEQWRRIYEMGERAGIYYAAAEGKLRALELPDPTPQEPSNLQSPTGALAPETLALEPVTPLSLGDVGTTDDTGNTQALRRLKLRVPILAKPGSRIQPRDAVIQVFFYDQLKDGSLVETNANVTSSWARRTNPSGDVLAVDWSTSAPEVLEVEYAQPEYAPKDPRAREQRIYFGYSVRVYYKGLLNAKFASPIKLLNQFIPPATLPSSDLPQ